MVATGLVAAGVLVMAAEAETTTAPAAATTVPPRTVSVQGVANEPLDPAASAATATATYRQAMAAAIGDGQAKAQFLAEKAGATLGAVQDIGEGGGYIQCPEGEEYQGGQPDFGYGSAVIAGAESVPARSPAARPLHKAPAKPRHKQHSAKKAAAESCTLSTQIALVYQVG
jgi:hypothetical protein